MPFTQSIFSYLDSFFVLIPKKLIDSNIHLLPPTSISVMITQCLFVRITMLLLYSKLCNFLLFKIIVNIVFCFYVGAYYSPISHLSIHCWNFFLILKIIFTFNNTHGISKMNITKMHSQKHIIIDTSFNCDNWAKNTRCNECSLYFYPHLMYLFENYNNYHDCNVSFYWLKGLSILKCTYIWRY